MEDGLDDARPESAATPSRWADRRPPEVDTPDPSTVPTPSVRAVITASTIVQGEPAADATLGEMSGPAGPTGSSATANDEEFQRGLREVSAELTGIDPPATLAW